MQKLPCHSLYVPERVALPPMCSKSQLPRQWVTMSPWLLMEEDLHAMEKLTLDLLQHPGLLLRGVNGLDKIFEVRSVW